VLPWGELPESIRRLTRQVGLCPCPGAFCVFGQGQLLTSCSWRITIRRWMHKIEPRSATGACWTVVQQEQVSSYVRLGVDIV